MRFEVIRDEPPKDILAAILEEPGISARRLAKKLNMRIRLVERVASKQLCRRNLITIRYLRKKNGWTICRVHYFPTEKGRQYWEKYYAR